jgi:hypothetical protein
VSVKKADH